MIRLPERGGRLDHDQAERQPGDDTVASRKMPALGRGAERRLGEHRATLGDLGLQARVFGRVGLIEPAGDGCHRLPDMQCAAVGGGIDAARHAGDDH